MTRTGWRTLCFVLAATCSWQAWRGCTRPRAPVCEPSDRERAAVAPDDRARTDGHTETAADGTARGAPRGEAPALGDPVPRFGMQLPGWARSLLPQAGEDLRAYRDRMIPLAQLALAPQRARVARSREDLAAAIGLDDRQRGELDGAATETATAIEDRLFDAVLSGELSPSTFKPMAGVAVARDVLDLLDRGNKRFLASLRTDQRDALANHPFDFGDYLVFSTRWEDAISGL